MKTLHLSIDATSLCKGRNCKHCACNSGSANIKHFSLNLLSKLGKGIKRSGFRKVFITFTGGGEPFLNPRLIQLVDHLFNTLGSRLTRLRFVTSGFLPEEHIEGQQFMNLLKRRYARNPLRLEFILSFNLFGQHFPERLKNTLAVFFKSDQRVITIHTCFSHQGFRDTFQTLDKTLDELEIITATQIDPWLVQTWDPNVDLEMFDSRIWSEEKYPFITGESFLQNCLFFAWPRDACAKAIVIHPFPHKKAGRAKKLNEDPWHNPRCSYIYGWDKRDYLHLDAEGNFFPSCECSESREMLLGKLGTIPLKEALRRRRIVQRKTLRCILQDRRIFDREGFCQICKGHKTANFKF